MEPLGAAQAEKRGLSHGTYPYCPKGLPSVHGQMDNLMVYKEIWWHLCNEARRVLIFVVTEIIF